MNDFAIAISVYNRFQDVRLLVDLIRANWPGKYYIAVCSSHADATRELADCPIDALLGIGDYPMEGPPITDPRVAPRARLWVRVIDSQRKLGQQCAEHSQAPYTIHLHADACPLSWQKLAELVATMREHGKYFAARGEGFAFYTANEPVGGFDDMFYVFDNTFARTHRLWDLDPYDFLPHKISIHGMLAILGLARVGLDRFYHFSTHREAVHWDGQPNYVHPFNSAQPMYFDPRYTFLHIHEDAFPDQLAHRLKAYYLRRFGITKGTHIQKFLATWEMPEGQLFEALRVMERRLRCFFYRRGLSPARYGRNFDQMQATQRVYQALPLPRKLTWLLGSHLHQAKAWFSSAVRKRYIPRHLFYSCYLDTVWPDRLETLYTQTFPNWRSDGNTDTSHGAREPTAEAIFCGLSGPTQTVEHLRPQIYPDD